VDVEVRHRLAAVRSVVDDDAEPRVEHPCKTCYLLSAKEKRTKQCGVFGLGLPHARDEFFRNDQHMHRRLGLDIVEGEPLGSFGYDLCGNLPGDNFFEQCHFIE
jgi:hypothetical protein